MKTNKFFLLAMLVLSSVFLNACSTKSKTILQGEKAPFTRFAMMDGTYKTTDNFRGKNLLLLFWATTCSRSQSVFDDVSEWLAANSRRARIQAVSVSIDKLGKEDKVKSVISKPELSNLQHAFSGNDIYDEAYIAYDVGELPTLVLIDPYGKVIGSGDSVSVLEEAFPQP